MKFFDLNQQHKRIEKQIKYILDEVFKNGSFIQGEEVKVLEEKLAQYVGAECTTVANGTDALLISLMALDIKKGDEVIVPSFTWVSSVETIKLVGAKPVFSDVSLETFNMEASSIENLISNKTKAIMAVSLFGQCADLLELKKITKKNKIFLIEDAAQSFGAIHFKKKSCSIADISTTSFFPTKPLGCYGDGGAIFSKKKSIINKANIISKHGQIKRYKYKTIGLNSRLDTIQAAVLLEKLKIFQEEKKIKNDIACEYDEFFSKFSFIKAPLIKEHNESVYALYTLKVDSFIRNKLYKYLLSEKVPCGLYYPQALHKSKPYKSNINLPITDKLNKSVLSIPMHAYLTKQDLNKIKKTFRKFSHTK